MSASPLCPNHKRHLPRANHSQKNRNRKHPVAAAWCRQMNVQAGNDAMAFLPRKNHNTNDFGTLARTAATFKKKVRTVFLIAYDDIFSQQ